MSNMTDFLENRIVDWLLRGQAYTPPTTVHIGLFTVAAGDAGGQTEVTGGSYARAAVSATLANFAGTQSAGSTTASTGTSGQTSNNNVVNFPTPTADWGTVVGIGIFDAASGGNLLFYAPLAANKTINNGDAVSFAAGALTITFA